MLTALGVAAASPPVPFKAFKGDQWWEEGERDSNLGSRPSGWGEKKAFLKLTKQMRGSFQGIFLISVFPWKEKEGRGGPSQASLAVGSSSQPSPRDPSSWVFPCGKRAGRMLPRLNLLRAAPPSLFQKISRPGSGKKKKKKRISPKLTVCGPA